MKNILKPGSIAFGFGLMLTTLGQAQQGAPSGTPLTFKVLQCPMGLHRTDHLFGSATAVQISP